MKTSLILKNLSQRSLAICCVALTVLYSAPLLSHSADLNIPSQVTAWLDSLGENKAKAQFAADDSRRYDFRWVPGVRAGLRLDEMTGQQTHALRDVLNVLLSRSGSIKVDAIIATEAALAVIQNSPSYRNPKKYYTAVFGEPGSKNWALRFEGHHLSINLSFIGEELVSATPLFLGVNPETIPAGPDKGLRALKLEVDLAKQLHDSFSASQRLQASASNEWFSGFLTDAGTRRADLGKPVGIVASELDKAQSELLRRLISAYVETINADFSGAYLQSRVSDDWKNIRFYWKGSGKDGDDYYYRIRGTHLLIEHETQSGDSHIHAVWRDAAWDFDAR